jgi:hypothetical protein
MSSPQCAQSRRGGGASGGLAAVYVTFTHKPAVADTPTNHSPRVALGPYREGEDFRRVQPGDREPCGAKRRGEDENHAGRGDTIARGRGDVARVASVEAKAREASAEEHGDTLDDGTPVEGVSSSDPVEGEDADERGELKSGGGQAGLVGLPTM